MQLDAAAQQFQAQNNLRAAPVLRIVGDANVFCADAAGDLVAYDHETNEIEPVNMSFWELFEREVAELRQRKLRKVSET